MVLNLKVPVSFICMEIELVKSRTLLDMRLNERQALGIQEPMFCIETGYVIPGLKALL